MSNRPLKVLRVVPPVGPLRLSELRDMNDSDRLAASYRGALRDELERRLAKKGDSALVLFRMPTGWCPEAGGEAANSLLGRIPNGRPGLRILSRRARDFFNGSLWNPSRFRLTGTRLCELIGDRGVMSTHCLGLICLSS